MKYTYLWVNFGTIIIPFLFSFHPRLQFHKQWKFYLPAMMLAGLIFIVWDVLFTQMGVWGFDDDYITGLHLLNLPIEEVLFFVCIPYACVFTYHCLSLFFKLKWPSQTEKRVVITLAIALLVTGLLAMPRAYTSTTFISLGVLILFAWFVIKINWFSKLTSVYAVLIIPFFIVNGILTGTGLEEPVVWYNNAENLAIRLGTIPVEDIFYGFELIFLNVLFYESFKQKFSKELPTA